MQRMNHKIKQCLGLEEFSGEKISVVLDEPLLLQFVPIESVPVSGYI